MTVTNTSANSLLQLTSAESVRGEVASLYMLAMRGGISLGCLATGLAVHAVGIREALLINGVLAVVCQYLVGRSSWQE